MLWRKFFRTVVVHGLGVVGKIQLAVEYTWKHLDDYVAALWARADSPEAPETTRDLAIYCG
jgi:hypothetical protein